MFVCFAAVDLLAAGIALVALVVSAASLYLSSLRKASIECDPVPSASAVLHTGAASRSGTNTLFPTINHTKVCIFVSNSGASSGILESLTVEAFRTVTNGGKPLWDVAPPHRLSGTGAIGDVLEQVGGENPTGRDAFVVTGTLRRDDGGTGGRPLARGTP